MNDFGVKTCVACRCEKLLRNSIENNRDVKRVILKECKNDTITIKMRYYINVDINMYV